MTEKDKTVKSPDVSEYDQRYEPPEKQMGFRGGFALFLSKIRSQRCAPVEIPRRNPRKNQNPYFSPRVEFNEHIYRTHDPRIARGLIEDETNFAQDAWGWTLDPSCLDPSLMQLWGRLSRWGKRKVALMSLDGHTPDVIQASIKPEQDIQQKVAPAEAKEETFTARDGTVMTFPKDMPKRERERLKAVHLSTGKVSSRPDQPVDAEVRVQTGASST